MHNEDITKAPALSGEVWRGIVPISTDDGEVDIACAIMLREADGRPFAHLLHDGVWHTLDDESCGAVFAVAFLSERAKAEEAGAIAAAEREARDAAAAMRVASDRYNDPMGTDRDERKRTLDAAQGRMREVFAKLRALGVEP